jgi:Zn finger protein HypA/HybF involved in hydrogenase expression
MKYKCDKCGQVVEGEDLHEDPCPGCGGLLYDALMLDQEGSYGN